VKYALRKAGAKDDDTVIQHAENTKDLVEGSMALMQQVAAMMTVLTFVQMSSTLVEIDFNWPLTVKWFSTIVARIGSFDLIGVAAPECAMETALKPMSRWMLTLVVPLAPLMFLGLLMCVAKIVRMLSRCWAKVLSCTTGDFCCCNTVADTMSALTSWLNNKAVSIFLVIYVLLVRAAMAPFDCVETEAGTSFMRDSPDVLCEADGSDYNLYFGFGVLALVACCLAIAIIAIQLYCFRHKLHTDKRIMREYATLYLRYEDTYYYWEVIIFVRKLLFVAILRVCSNDQTLQIGLLAVVLGGALVLQYRCKPFLSDALDQLEEYTLLACGGLVLLGVGSYLGMPPLATTVLYVVLVGTASAFMVKALRAVWREDIAESTADDGTEDTSGGQDRAPAAVSRARIVL
jgi:hypothetical protein